MNDATSTDPTIAYRGTVPHRMTARGWVPLIPDGEGHGNDPAAGGAGGGAGSGSGSGSGEGGGGGAGGAGASGSGDDDALKALADLAAREKGQGKRAGQREVLEALGVDKIEDAKAILDAHREAEEARQDEVTKATKRADDAEAARKKAEGDRQLVERTRSVEREVVLAGFNLPDKDAKAEDRELARKNLDRVVRMVLAELPDGADADEPSTIESTVSTIKGEVPALFGTASTNGGGGRRLPSGESDRGGTTGGTPPPRGAGGEDDLDAGRKAARESYVPTPASNAS